MAYGCIDLTVEPYGFMVKELEAFVWQPTSYFKSFQQKDLAEMGSLQFEHMLPFLKYAQLKLMGRHICPFTSWSALRHVLVLVAQHLARHLGPHCVPHSAVTLQNRVELSEHKHCSVLTNPLLCSALIQGLVFE